MFALSLRSPPRIFMNNADQLFLNELVNTFSDANFSNPEYNGEKLSLKSKDILGHVYEYFLG